MNNTEIKLVENTLDRSINEVLKVMARAEASALRKGANTLKKNVKQAIRACDFDSTSRNAKYGDRLIDAVRSGKVNNGSVVVHIMGSQSKGSGTYRLRFFEGGTKERIQKTINGKLLNKPRNLKRIKAYNFFDTAINSSQSELLSSMDEQLTKYIEKAWNNG